jgi:tetratricopeptide (TPR) repeat protein
MRERAPGNSQVNVELARMAARAGEDADAKRYYNEAIYGVWDEKAEDILRSRMDTRLELYRYLTDRGEKTEAQSILLAIAAATPADATAHTQVGELMLQAGQPQQALAEFQRALRLDGRNYEALAGAGEANFQLGIDREAVRYLESATRDEVQQKRKPGAPDADPAGRQEEAARVARELAIAQATLALDPNRPGLDAMERARRAIRAYDAAVTRIESCAREHGVALPDPSANLTPFTDAPSDELAQAWLARHIDQLQPIMEFIFQNESAATENCGPPSDAANAALVRIGERAQSARP